jgi:hypothetical protein
MTGRIAAPAAFLMVLYIFMWCEVMKCVAEASNTKWESIKRDPNVFNEPSMSNEQ